jgi:hypothetical protein
MRARQNIEFEGSGPVSDDLDIADWLWDRAEKCRALAEAAADPLVRKAYRKLASSYVTLARDEEALRHYLQKGK